MSNRTSPPPEIPFGDLLWPGGLERGVGQPGTTYLPVRRSDGVRSLLPADAPALLRRSLTRSNGPESTARDLARQTYAAVASTRHRLGGRRWTSSLVHARDTGLRDALAAVVGRDVHLAVHFGPLRANRKPVVHAWDGSGQLAAVAKLAVGPLTEQLIRNESATLAELATGPGPGHELTVPRVLALTEWSGAPMLVQSVVPTRGRHTVPGPATRLLAERAVASLPRAESGEAARFVEELRRRLETVPADPPGSAHTGVDRMLAALDDVAETHDLDEVPAGPWHGDWSPQNLAVAPSGVGAWDWERFAGDRPHGFDTLHFHLQELLSGGGDPQPGVKLVTEAPRLLAPWQDRPRPEQARAIAVLLLLDLAARYLGDGQAGTGSPGARVGQWVLPALTTYQGSARA